MQNVKDSSHMGCCQKTGKEGEIAVSGGNCRCGGDRYSLA